MFLEVLRVFLCFWIFHKPKLCKTNDLHVLRLTLLISCVKTVQWGYAYTQYFLMSYHKTFCDLYISCNLQITEDWRFYALEKIAREKY